jgi:hypothetical protein
MAQGLILLTAETGQKARDAQKPPGNFRRAISTGQFPSGNFRFPELFFTPPLDSGTNKPHLSPVWNWQSLTESANDPEKVRKTLEN